MAPSPPAAGRQPPPGSGWQPAPAPWQAAPYGPTGQAWGPPPHPSGTTDDERTMGMLVHVLGLLTGIVGPLVLWLVKKDGSRFIDAHGRSALNFHVSLLVYAAVFFAAFFVVVITTFGWGGFVLLPFIFIAVLGFGILSLVCGILGAMRANEGKMYTYPLAIPMFGRP